MDSATGPGRSIGGAPSKPKLSAPCTIPVGPMVSVPIWAKALLHDWARIVNSVPPQASPSKFEMGAP